MHKIFNVRGLAARASLLLIVLLSACAAPVAPIDTAASSSTPAPSATADVSTPDPPPQTATAEPSAALRYLWPTRVPDGLIVQQEQSAADERGFTLELIDPADAQRTLTLRGGDGLTPPPAPGSTAITVREQPGLAFTTGAGYLIYWQEQGQPYTLAGFFGADELAEIAAALEPLELASWREHLDTPRAWTQNTSALSAWPARLPEGFMIDLAESGSGEMGAQLALVNTADPEQRIFIRSGGSATEGEPGPRVTVRGLPGTSSHTAAGWSVHWWENRQGYTVGSASFNGQRGGLPTLDEALALAESVELIDVQTWLARLDDRALQPPVAPEVCRRLPSDDAKSLGSVTLVAPFCVVWRDTRDDERGFRITLRYVGSGKQFSYEVGPNIEQYVVPEDDRPATGSPEECALRSSFSLSVEALLPDGPILIGGMAMDSECGQGFAPTPTPTAATDAAPPAETPLDPRLAALDAEIETLVGGWAGTHAVSVTDLDSGETIGVHGDRPQLAACTIKIVIMIAVAQDIEAGRYSADDIAALVESAMGPSNTWSARELLGRIGAGDIGAGVHRVNAILAELGATGSILTHPPGYPTEEYGYMASLGIDENRLTTDDLNLILGKLYRGEVLSDWATEYVLHSMTIAPDWMDQPLRAAVGAEAQVYHKIGQLYAPEQVWNDAAIVVFERDGQRHAYALSYLGGYGASWQESYSHEAELAALVWSHLGPSARLAASTRAGH